jgi:hypothetical protein
MRSSEYFQSNLSCLCILKYADIVEQAGLAVTVWTCILEVLGLISDQVSGSPDWGFFMIYSVPPGRGQDNTPIKLWFLPFKFSICHLPFCAIQSGYTSITSWSWDLLENLPVVQLLKNFPTFYGTRRFITVFTRALHWSLSLARSIQSIPPHPISVRSILILSTHLHLGLPGGLLPSGLSWQLLMTLTDLRSRLTEESHWFSLYSVGMDCVENSSSNSVVSCCICVCSHRNVFIKSLPCKGRCRNVTTCSDICLTFASNFFFVRVDVWKYIRITHM